MYCVSANVVQELVLQQIQQLINRFQLMASIRYIFSQRLSEDCFLIGSPVSQLNDPVQQMKKCHSPIGNKLRNGSLFRVFYKTSNYRLFLHNKSFTSNRLTWKVTSSFERKEVWYDLQCLLSIAIFITKISLKLKEIYITGGPIHGIWVKLLLLFGF